MRRIKYPRTYHVPWSPGTTKDDKRHADVEPLFSGVEVVVTEKLDGENTTVYADGYTHARSTDSAGHQSRDVMRGIAARLGGEGFPETLRVCGENMFARHSIPYGALPGYFLVFAVFDGDIGLSWDETVEWCALLDLPTVPVLYRGPWDEKAVRACWTGQSTASPGDLQEGYVIRVAGRFTGRYWRDVSAKYVREAHVKTGKHWMHDVVVRNGLRGRG